jgi:hypothetical protein
MFRKFIVPFFLGLLLFSCTKKEEKLISGNTPPPDGTIPSSLRVSFINKSYIGLLGREPDASEFSSAQLQLESNNFSKESRKALINTILTNESFYDREFELYGNDLLNSTDTIAIHDMIFTFEFLLTSPAYMEQWPLIQIELDRLIALRDVPAGLKNGTVSIIEMQRRCIDNYFFDQINMGSLNFVIACFQHLLLRNPTEFEKTEGVKIVDGFSGILFLEIAESKVQFEDIFFASDDYYEGQVKLLFFRFLFRQPNSEEAAYYSTQYKSDNNFKALIAELLSTGEYAGLNE